MIQWMAMYRKEMLEMWRSGKWLWVPAVSILLCVMNPVSSYFMPLIIEKAGNLPDGAIIQIPPPQAAQVMRDTLSQFSLMGLLILVLAGMGVVASERAGGILAMITVKPVSPVAFLTAKWAGLLTLAGASFGAGYGAAWYYTEILIGPVAPGRALAAFGSYALWLVFILTVTLLMSTWLKSGAAAAFTSLFTAAVLSVLTGLLPKYMVWSPGRLGSHAAVLLADGKPMEYFTLSLTITFLLVFLVLAASIRLFAVMESSET